MSDDRGNRGPIRDHPRASDAPAAGRRALGRVRLSRDAEGSTSEARQREAIEAYARLHGLTIVGWAVDMDVSGSLSPFEAPELGSWLNEWADEYDVLVAWKLDRLGRTLFGLNGLFKWSQDHGKVIACIDDHIDLNHWTGRLVASVIAGVAEGELEAIKLRNRQSRAKHRETGRYHGGPVPYGYRKFKYDDGWFLEIDPDTAEIVSGMADAVLDGISVRGIVTNLNERGVPAPGSERWTHRTVARLLRSRNIVGQVEYNGTVVLGDDGMPQQRAEPVIPVDTWQRVCEALNGQSRPVKRTGETWWLLNVAYCALCESPLYFHRQTVKGKAYRYAVCSGKDKGTGCKAASIPAEQLETQVEELFLDEIGNEQRQERVFVPGSDNREALATVNEAIETARDERDLGLYDGDREGYLARMATLVERRKALEAQGTEPSRWELRPTGESYRDAWQGMTPAERRSLMLDTGIRFWSQRRPWYLRIHVPRDIVEQAIPSYAVDVAE